MDEQRWEQHEPQAYDLDAAEAEPEADGQTFYLALKLALERLEAYSHLPMG